MVSQGKALQRLMEEVKDFAYDLLDDGKRLWFRYPSSSLLKKSLGTLLPARPDDRSRNCVELSRCLAPARLTRVAIPGIDPARSIEQRRNVAAIA